MATLDQVPGAVLLVDESCTVTAANNPCAVVFGMDSETLRGRSLRTLQHDGVLDGSARECWEQAVSAVLTGAAEAVTEEISMASTGQETGLRYTLRVTQSEQSGMARCSLRSVGTSRGYEETVTALHHSTRELMDADDVETVLRRTAAAANDVLGFPGTAVREHDSQRDMLHHIAFGGRVGDIESRPSFSVETSPHGRAIRRGETVVEDVPDDDPYDREAFTQTMYVPIGDIGLLSVGTVGTNFDEMDVQFAEILAENATAAARVVDTTSRLRAERERLDRFASVISHDIRNPLQTAMLSLDLARETGDTGRIETAIESLERVERIIEGTLTLARSEQLDDELVTGELDELVRSAWNVAGSDEATLVVEDSEDIECEPSLTQSLLENLVRNAVEHNDQPPTVSVGTLDGGGFYVADDGEGVPEADRRRLLDERGREGDGFGLSIVHDIVEAHGWEFTLTESAHGGARFEVRIG